MIQQLLPDGIRCIQVPTPYPVGPVNCYVLTGTVTTLVDCGPATAEAEAVLRDGLHEIGVRPSDLRAIVLTHHHPDHVGGLHWLARETSAAGYAHATLLRWNAGGAAASAGQASFFARLLAYCGAPAPAAADMLARLKQQRAGYHMTIAEQALREGDSVALGSGNWQVFETPGHAGTSICLLDRSGILIGGDTLLHRISSNALPEPPEHDGLPRPRTLLAYRHSLERLAGLSVSLVLPGHGPAFDGHAALIAQRLHNQDERAKRLLSLIGEPSCTIHALATKLFPEIGDGQLFLGLSEVLGHLDLLEDRELAWHEGDAPALYYRLNH